MDASPILSVCIPTYNRQDWLRLCLAALAPQIARTGGRAEIVVSDNASTDGTQQVMEEMQQVYPIRCSRNEVNIGANPNFYRLAAELARGRYVWILGDDDIVRPDGLERVLRVLEDHPELRYVYVNYTRWMIEQSPAFPLLPQDLPGLAPAGHADFEDKPLERLSEIAAGDYNCFTPIYCSVFRQTEAAEAYRVNPAEAAFSSLATVSPQAVYIAEHLLNEPAWYIGYPCVITTPPQGWDQFRPAYVLRLLPQLYDLFQNEGVSVEVMDAHRRFLLSTARGVLRQTLLERDLPFWGRGALWQFAWRFRRFPEVWRLLGWGLALKIYLAGPVQPLRALWRRVKGKKAAP